LFDTNQHIKTKRYMYAVNPYIYTKISPFIAINLT